MKRILATGSTAIAIMLLPLAAQAQQSPSNGQGASAKAASARQAAVQECRQMFARTGRGAKDNTTILVEQCVKEKTGKK